MATLQTKEICPNYSCNVRWSLFERTKYILPESYTLPVEVTLHGELSIDVQVPEISLNSGLPYNIQQPVLLRSWTSTNIGHRSNGRKESDCRRRPDVEVGRTEIYIVHSPTNALFIKLGKV